MDSRTEFILFQLIQKRPLRKIQNTFKIKSLERLGMENVSQHNKSQYIKKPIAIMILNEGNSKHSNKKDKSDHFNHFYPI